MNSALAQFGVFGLLVSWLVSACVVFAPANSTVSAQAVESEEYVVLRELADLPKAGENTFALQLMDDPDLLKSILPRLQTFNSLRKLRVSWCDVPAGLWKHVNDCPKLEHLEIQSSNISEEELAGLTLEHLVFLDISGCNKLTPAVFAKLAIFSKLEVLKAERFNFSRSAELKSVNSLTFLKTLSLSRSADLTDRQLEQLITDCPIAELELFDCATLTKLTEVLGKLTNLRRLNLAGCKGLSDKAALNISRCGSLVHLNLHAPNAMTADGFALIGECRSLEQLYVCASGTFSDAAMLKWTGLTKLRLLDLTRCKLISGSGFKAFSESKTLETLIARECETLDDSGVKNLGNIKTLSSIDVDLCPKVTQAALSQLEAALPDCEILPPPGMESPSRSK